MPDNAALVERLAEAIDRAGMEYPWQAEAAARSVLPIVEDYAKAERKAGAVDAEAAIDRAAEAFYELALGKAMFAGRDGPPWASMSDVARKCWRDDMRPVVEAVLSER